MNSIKHLKKATLRNQLALFFFCMLILPAWQHMYGQACTTPPTSLVNGNFDTPAGAIGPANTGINDDLAGWFVAHGDPSTAATAPRSMWMWSYMSSGGVQRGEGVFNCYDFQAGESYLICFDLQTNGKADGATVNVRATSAFSPYYGSSWVFPLGTPNELIWQDLVANYTYANWTQISVVYTPTVNNTQIWFHPFWSGMPPGTPAPEGNPSQSEMRIDNVSITQLSGGQSCPCDLTADYTYSTNDSCGVQFNDATSSNCCTNVLGYQWDFGDGTTATGANPLHTFPGAGTYNVCLVTVGLNALGDCCTDSVCYEVTVECDTCECDVAADFRYSADKCKVTFQDLSTHNSCTEITDWSWDFGDGNTSNLQNPVHNYSASGSYTVCLRVVGTTPDGEECSDMICYDVEVICDDEPCPCEVFTLDFGYNVNRCRVDFFGFGEADCPIIGWEWDFGDGGTSTLQNPSHVYGANGSYIVCFTIIMSAPDGTECRETLCLPVEITDCGDADNPDFKTNPASGGVQNELPFEHKIYPNPSAGKVYVEFETKAAMDVEVYVYDASMQPVAKLMEGTQEAGVHNLEWNSDNGIIASGTYFIMIKQGHTVNIEKVIVNK
jgi:PKD repeat protein